MVTVDHEDNAWEQADIPDPRHDPQRAGADAGNGRPGNMPRGEELQGYGILGSHPPPFDPINQADEAFEFYQENGFVVVNSLGEQEVADLNSVCDEFVTTRGPEIDVPGQGQLFFPLLNYPEFDFTVVHPNTYPMVQRILGGADKPRLIEFNCKLSVTDSLSSPSATISTHLSSG